MSRDEIDSPYFFPEEIEIHMNSKKTFNNELDPLWYLLLIAIAGLLFAMGINIKNNSGQLHPIVGKWARSTISVVGSSNNTYDQYNDCESAYPLFVEYFQDSTYVGSSDLSLMSGDILWLGGDFQLVEENRLKMQTKIGVSIYEYSSVDNILTIHDDGNCEIAYERVN